MNLPNGSNDSGNRSDGRAAKLVIWHRWRGWCHALYPAGSITTRGWRTVYRFAPDAVGPLERVVRAWLRLGDW